MKIVIKSQRRKFRHDPDCVICEYLMDDKAIDGCVVKLNGRYPEKGFAMNTVSKEMAYVIAGSGKIIVENKEYDISEGDVLLINSGEKFFWQGNMELFISCTPAWNTEQYRVI